MVVVVVAVHAVHLEIGAVEVDMTVLDGHLGQALAMRDDLVGVALAIDRDSHVIEEGVLGVPEARALYGELSVIASHLGLGNGQAIDGKTPHDALGAGSLHIERDVRRIILAMGAHTEVVQACGGTLHEINIAEDARRPPHILVLDVGAIAVLEDLHCEQVLALMQKLGDIELRRKA